MLSSFSRGRRPDGGGFGSPSPGGTPFPTARGMLGRTVGNPGPGILSGGERGSAIPGLRGAPVPRSGERGPELWGFRPRSSGIPRPYRFRAIRIPIALRGGVLIPGSWRSPRRSPVAPNPALKEVAGGGCPRPGEFFFSGTIVRTPRAPDPELETVSRA